VSDVGRTLTSPSSITSPFALRLPDRIVPLSTGSVVVGRSLRCDIIISERKVSRRHARLVVQAHEVVLEEISRMNRVWVNDRLIAGSQRLQVGDRIAFGPVRAELCAIGGRYPSLKAANPGERAAPAQLPGLQASIPASNDPAPAYLDDKKQDGARTMLERFVLRCELGPDVPSEELEMIVALATRFAESTKDGAWVNYVFRVFTALGRTLPGAIVDRLCGLLPRVSGTSLTTFREYVAALQAASAQHGPRDQLLVRRIQGLEPLIARQTRTVGT
jgi:type III secretion system (T3SS) inner membrane Yop/YscD-like protein